MRHTPRVLTFAIGFLATTMRMLTDIGRLVAAARRQQLLSPHSLPACIAAIALPAVTVRTDREESIAAWVTTSVQTKAPEGQISCRRFRHLSITIPEKRMIGQMTRAFGADDVARLRRSPKKDDF
jgi:hypothetical protein